MFYVLFLKITLKRVFVTDLKSLTQLEQLKVLLKTLDTLNILEMPTNRQTAHLR